MIKIECFAAVVTDFLRPGVDKLAWNVVSQILYPRHSFCTNLTEIHTDLCRLRQNNSSTAEKVDVRVFEETRALSINFANNNINGRSISTKWENTIDRSVSETISFHYLLDPTSRDRIIAQKYLKHWKINVSLRYVACWGDCKGMYWKGTGMYAPGTSRHNVPWFKALTGMFSLLNAVDFILYFIYSLHFDRRIWLELVHSLAQWDDLRQRRHEGNLLDPAQ